MNVLRARRAPLVVLILGVGAVAAIPALAAERFALMPLKRRVRDAAAAAAVENALELQLTRFGEVVGRLRSREVLRALRLRDIDAAPARLLTELADTLDVDWLVSATVHDLPRHEVPDLSVSARFYQGDTGQLGWAGFLGRSGLDGRTLLGLGTVDSIEALAPALVQRLLADVPLAGFEPGSSGRSGPAPAVERLGAVALVPFTGYIRAEALTVAEAATEAQRAVLHRLGVRLAAGGCVHESLRRQRAQVWGELSAETRRYLSDVCGADRLLTGSVELWNLTGSGTEPEPEIALALRLLDAESGRIQWMGSREAAGWDGVRLLGLGRIYSRGVLLDRLLSELTEELIRHQDTASTKESRG